MGKGLKMKIAKKVLVVLMGFALVFSQMKLSVRADESLKLLKYNLLSCQYEEMDIGMLSMDGLSGYTVETYDGQTTLDSNKIYRVTTSQPVGKITVNAEVGTPAILVLGRGVTLTVNGGINVKSGKGIRIYSEYVDSLQDMGKLVAYGDSETCQAAIGSDNNYNGGNIIIYSGNIYAEGVGSTAGIGGADMFTGGDISIYGGIVTAIGGNGGAGIGGGSAAAGDNIYIYGGIVTATGGNGGAGIGGGLGHSGGNIYISGGTVTATGGSNAAGIGGGGYHSTFNGENAGHVGKVYISGGEVTATGGEGGAGIGSGYKSGNNSQDTIALTGGKITAIGGTGARGIGSGSEAEDISDRIDLGGVYSNIPSEIFQNGNVELTLPGGNDDGPQNDESSSRSEGNSRLLTFSFGNGGTCTIDQQGPLCVAVFKAATPAGFSEAFSFNLNTDVTGINAPNYENKEGNFVLTIPDGLRKQGRAFALIGVDINGRPKLFFDNDTLDETFSTHLDMDGYAFSLIYK